MRNPPPRSSRKPASALFAGLALAASCAGAPQTFNVMDYGVTGRDIRTDTAAIQRAIDACSAQGGGRVVVPAGAKITIATLELRSHVDLHLERGALLQGSAHHSDFTRFSLQPVTFDGIRV